MKHPSRAQQIQDQVLARAGHNNDNIAEMTSLRNHQVNHKINYVQEKRQIFYSGSLPERPPSIATRK
jgi:long-subunit fatty acid transport protein